MKILFDLLGAHPNGAGSKFHGGGEYIKTVFKRLVETIGDNELAVVLNKELFLDDWIINMINENLVEVINVSDYMELNIILKKQKIDVFYSGMPYQWYNNQFPENMRIIGTFHGLRGIEKPIDRYTHLYFSKSQAFIKFVKYYIPLFNKKQLLFYMSAFDKYDDVVCVSNHTKYAVVNNISNNKKTHVFYTPAKYVCSYGEDLNAIKYKYILMIGCDRWEKNTYRAMIAIDELIEKGFLGEYKIITVGEIPRKIRKRIKHIEKYIEYGYVDADVLENLYRNCDIFLFPSLNEGFGMPPLEAMKYGKTVVASAVCSIPEVCGGAVYYFNPYDVKEMQNRILMAIDKKIDEEIVFRRFEMIKRRQELDLDKLCKFILGEDNG